MPRFRKKPVEIEAIQWTGANLNELASFIDQGMICAVYGNGLTIATLEGQMAADPNDWIIQGVAGEFYPCKPDIFAASYDEA